MMLLAETVFGRSDCDSCGEMDVPIAYMNEEEFAWCQSCWDDRRDERAVALAEQWWPNRYIGDLTTAEWKRIYEALTKDEQ